ncbi:MAG TPA: hypothetical protein ENN51_05660, partial [candidate division WOR-3 bacterium]|nr:hypothetical protein [candidate division WOR-3 bacterium]
MKRTIIVAALVLLLPSLLAAYPGIGGGRGLFRVQNALVESDAGLTISLNAIGRNPTSGTDNGWVADLIAPELSYAPLSTRWVGAELFANWGGIFQYAPDTSTKQNHELTWGLHDLKTGAKLSIPFIPVLKLGAIVDYNFYSREEKDWLDPNAIPMQDGLG